MAGNPPSSGAQPLWPHPTMAPQSFAPSNTMQYRPMLHAQQQQYMPPSSAPQQFRPVLGQNVGMPPGQNQVQQYSQAMHQFLPRPGQSSAPPSFQQQFQAQYVPSSMGQQQNVPGLTNQVPGAGGQGVSFSSSYTFQPSMQRPAPVGGEPQLQPGSNPPLIPMQPTTQQGITAAAASDANGSTATRQSASDWQEYESSDGRRYYYNKVTKQSSWEKPMELMTPIEMSWNSGEYNNCSKCSI